MMKFYCRRCSYINTQVESVKYLSACLLSVRYPSKGMPKQFAGTVFEWIEVLDCIDEGFSFIASYLMALVDKMNYAAGAVFLFILCI